MKKAWLLLPFFILTGCGEENIRNLDVEMFNAVGDSLGTINLEEQAKGVKLTLNLEGLPPGEHAMHIHENSKCEPPDFKSAGNHFNPEEKEHGLLHPKGAHAGDLPNLIVGEDGKVKDEIMAPQVSLKEGKQSLLTKDGTSIVIHDGKDDGMTQPAGDSGDRIACGSISKDKKK
ncbi:superoxide dismutase family protein [Bacillus sp. DTU_2020_1000418_1_SI_GHA_SEK_038]|uniref:superoxide dismutase family protein n=1 Tax=Bacillus sp. DTU_2020_1000418_1_SI_GHA_SEK_038 TaxID=3077585 RepID=UPI0028EBE018|nr:superoxide dismutase family protein [Bacillus sp. DTU_2020_1000418_1_SI_GHA_SEK_038]WNS74771.1 superoxide dismutase family protein [Bacillus sp. DTU_2020_1000418_1_SI_GHA_SEK_038]